MLPFESVVVHVFNTKGHMSVGEPCSRVHETSMEDESPMAACLVFWTCMIVCSLKFSRAMSNYYPITFTSIHSNYLN